MESVYSARIRAGKRRTYFFDVRATRGNDYYLTITESRKKFNEDGYDRHKLFLYKEDFNKFIRGLIEAVEYVKTDLMPDYDFDAFNHDTLENNNGPEENTSGESADAESSTSPDEIIEQTTQSMDTSASEPVVKNADHEEVDKW